MRVSCVVSERVGSRLPVDNHEVNRQALCEARTVAMPIATWIRRHWVNPGQRVSAANGALKFLVIPNYLKKSLVVRFVVLCGGVFGGGGVGVGGRGLLPSSGYLLFALLSSVRGVTPHLSSCLIDIPLA